jgi:hypothetical protein
MRLVSRPATAADVREFYPDWKCSFRAWVCELDGQVQGIIGVALLRPVACLFSAFKEPLRPFLKSLTVLRLIKAVQALVAASRVPVVALAEPGEPTAPDILTRLGFAYLLTNEDGEIYKWGGA